MEHYIKISLPNIKNKLLEQLHTVTDFGHFHHSTVMHKFHNRAGQKITTRSGDIW